MKEREMWCFRYQWCLVGQWISYEQVSLLLSVFVCFTIMLSLLNACSPRTDRLIIKWYDMWSIIWKLSFSFVFLLLEIFEKEIWYGDAVLLSYGKENPVLCLLGCYVFSSANLVLNVFWKHSVIKVSNVYWEYGVC